MTDRKFRDYCYEGLALGIFMFSAGFFDALIDHPALPIRQHMHSDLARRFLIGLTMGLTALYIFNAPFGKRSGAYINPAVTLVQYRLQNIDRKDAFFYILFQFIGGTVGMYLIYRLMPALISHPSINYIVTQPGAEGTTVAFIMEFIISFFIISTVLFTGNNKYLAKYTSLFVAILIALFITFEAPYSGMSMNPARTFSSAIISNQWKVFWLYIIAPIGGMLLGERIFVWRNNSTQRRKD